MIWFSRLHTLCFDDLESQKKAVLSPVDDAQIHDQLDWFWMIKC